MFKQFDALPPEAKLIREEVFVSEQGFQDEFDEIDQYATHLVFYDEEIPAAVCRYYPGQNPGEYIAGRIAVRKAYRQKHLGRVIMQTLDEVIAAKGGTKISLSAQLQVKTFYEKNGYAAVGEVYLDEHCPHVHMEKRL